MRLGQYVYYVQGYEGQALKYLEAHRNLDVGSVEIEPKGFQYEEHGKSRVYIPDMRVKLGRLWYIVEVKSDYTAGLLKNGKTMFYNLRRKAKAVHEAGLRFLVLIYLPRSNEIVEVSDMQEKSIADIRVLVQS